MRVFNQWLGIGLLTGCCLGCKPATPPPEAQPSTFALATDGAVVTENEAGFDKNAVRADFNADGLEDVAIIDVSTGANQITVYIRKKVPGNDSDDPVYFEAGSIRRTLEGNIIGLMSRKNGPYTDLIVLLAHPNRPNEMIHYRNDGKQFSEMR